MIRNISKLKTFVRAGTIQSRSFASFMTDEERSLRESISAYAKSTIHPKVAEMDHIGRMDSGLVKSLFEQV
jgi:hypothetical protein